MTDPSASPRKKDPMIGQVLAGRYEIEGRLGKGGMAVVYQAKDRSFGRDVAIKVLRTDVAKDPIAAKRLIREARAAGQLHHPHIITMHDVGTTEGMVYIVMEVLIGSELAEVMEEVGAIDVLRSLDIARQVASGLAVAHRAGIVHRDIKPENLFLIDTQSGGDYIKMLDFSIAKLPSAMVTAALTRAGSVFGTPHYMAPEQVEGRTVCPQTDLYALGAVLYECIAGEPPFDGDSVIDILLQHARAQPPKLSALGIWLPDGLSDLVDALLAKKESARPESATVVEHILERMIEETRRARASVPPTEVRAPVSDADIADFQRRGEESANSPRLPAEAPDDLPGPPSDLPGPPSDLPGAVDPGSSGANAALGSATLLGAGLADQVREALAEREAVRAAAAASIADIAPPPPMPSIADIAPPPPMPAAVPRPPSVSAPSSVVMRGVPPPPESRHRMHSKLRRESDSADQMTVQRAARAAAAQGTTATRRDLKPTARPVAAESQATVSSRPVVPRRGRPGPILVVAGVVGAAAVIAVVAYFIFV